MNKKVVAIILCFITSFLGLSSLNAGSWTSKSDCTSQGGHAQASKGEVYQWNIRVSGLDKKIIYLNENNFRSQYGKYIQSAIRTETTYVCCQFDPEPADPTKPDDEENGGGNNGGQNGGNGGNNGNGGNQTGGSSVETCDPPEPDTPPTCNEATSSDVSCSGTVEDPKLCAVMANGAGSNYRVGGNTYCDIYCREEVVLRFQDIVEVLAGRYFKHDVNKDQISNLSGVIERYSECGSKIKYKQWKYDYRQANIALVNLFNIWAQYEVACKEGPEKLEVIPANCPSCDLTCYMTAPCPSTGDCPDITLRQIPYYINGGPGGPGTVNHYYTESTKNYGFSTITSAPCDFKSSTIVGSDPSTSWDDGYFKNSCDCSGYVCDWKQGESVCAKAAAAKAAFDAKRAEIEKLIKQLEECNQPENYLQTGGDVPDVSPGCKSSENDPGGYEENYTFGANYEISIKGSTAGGTGIEKRYNINEKWSQICGGCNNDYGYSESGNLETLVKYDCDKTPHEGVYCEVKTKTYPSNGFVAARTSTEYQYRQETTFSTQLFTGKVVTGVPGKDFVKMEDNSWPIMLDRKDGIYNICYYFENLGSKGQFKPFTDDSCKYIVTNELPVYDCNDSMSYHECYECPDGEDCDACPDGEDCDDSIKSTLGVYFRSVDLSNLFPNSIYDAKSIGNISSVRELGFNWKDKGEIIKEIQSKGSDIWTSTSHPEVVVTLTPSAIRNIKQYNTGTNYLENSLDCDARDLSCSSKFLKNELIEYVGTDNVIIDNELFNNNRYTKPGGEE